MTISHTVPAGPRLSLRKVVCRTYIELMRYAGRHRKICDCILTVVNPGKLSRRHRFTPSSPRRGLDRSA